ncbi:MAG: hypothetical protein KDD42_02205, partial [Bdellovibrionales bacterium]|nr:hypothetical protein [Bdellovibrionales bacterium]
MITLAASKIITDILLTGTLLYLCVRVLQNRTQASGRELQVLESSLRRLIEEAEHSSRGLNDQLIKRQAELEKLLFDVGSVESRLNKGIDQAENVKKELQQVVSQPRESLVASNQVSSPEARSVISSYTQEPEESLDQPHPEPPSFGVIAEELPA